MLLSTDDSRQSLESEHDKVRAVLYLRNDGYRASLEQHKIYSALLDRDAAKHGQIRVIDESGEDYLYPASFCPNQASATSEVLESEHAE
jgi:hypothetical protein